MRFSLSLQNELKSRIRGEARFDGATRAIYSTDSSNYRLVPIGVVLPRDEDDVAHTLKLARENSIPILPRGGGTSLGGQGCNEALVIDFSKYMNAIRTIDRDRRTAVVEPGLVQNNLNLALAPMGLFFAPDPSTKDRCCIGG